MKKINLGQKEVIHFVGVGGIGMSGLALIMKNMGFQIQGSDQNKNKNTITCAKSGIKVFIGHSKNNVKSSSILVRSSAIKNNNIEIKYARKKNSIFQELKYLQMCIIKEEHYHYRLSRKNNDNFLNCKNSI